MLFFYSIAVLSLKYGQNVFLLVTAGKIILTRCGVTYIIDPIGKVAISGHISKQKVNNSQISSVTFKVIFL